ncbi:MAG: sugar-binding domain-containing protein [Paludibacter sp.]
MRIYLTFILLVSLVSGIFSQTPNTISLNGVWRFQVDSTDKGIADRWFARQLPETIELPGSMATNGKGNEITVHTQFTGEIVDSAFYKSPNYAKFREPGNVKIPFWLQSVKYYVGAAWYQKDIVIPLSWKGQNIELFLERCHWETRLWVDGIECGMRNSLGTPHIYILSAMLTPGKHTLTVCVDNRTKNIDPGLNSHSISDHTQTNWNGIVGELSLRTRPQVFVKNILVTPDISGHSIHVKVLLENTTEKKQKSLIALSVSGASSPKSKEVSLEVGIGVDTFQIEYPMGNDAKLWSEFHPFVYTLSATLIASKQTDSYKTTFGMREIKAAGTQLKINGKPLFLRGTLECAIFPKTGFPPTDTAAWARIFRICRAHGLNHVRFHSWCPPAAAFDMADKLGFYLHVECSSWANQSTTIGDGKPFDNYLYEESERMVETYGNHPSFCIMLYGNEPGGKNKDKFLERFVSYWKAKDRRRLYSSGAGWPNLEVNDFLSTPNPRIQGWGERLKSIINSRPPASDYDWGGKIAKFHQPVVSHEIGQWCVYPNFKEIAKYTGVVRAKNFEIFQETLKNNGMEQLADSFLLASGKLQALCYKADIEAALRTKSFGGFQLLDLHDFPGQGTALVGVLDAFWDEKGYITSKEYSRFCNSTVPLVRLKKHIYKNVDSLTASIEVAHYGDDTLKGCVPTWRINDSDGKVVLSGKLPQANIALGNCIALGQISIPLAFVQKAEKLILEVSVGSFTNSWDFWVYPSQKETISGIDNIRVVSTLDSATCQFLEKGGSVFLSLKKGSLKPEFGGTIVIGFSSIFWNTAWTKGQAPHTLGILCNPQHPALSNFPTEYYSNWQWWDAMSYSNAIKLTPLSADLKPIVRVIDDWFTNRSLGLIFEAKVGKGKILVSGIDFNNEMSKRPEAQQLLFSLKKYIVGSLFNPLVSLPASAIQNILK